MNEKSVADFALEFFSFALLLAGAAPALIAGVILAPGTVVREMAHRMSRWTWGAVPVLLVSGGIFVLARPQRYFTNPVFGIKFALLIPALFLAALLYRELKQRDSLVARTRVIAALNLVAWVGVVLAGRWIAYADYLFPPE